MGLESQLRLLARRLRELGDSLAEARLTAVEDRPVEPGVALVDQLEDRVTDLQAAVEDALTWLRPVLPRLGQPLQPVEMELAGPALATCHSRLAAVGVAYWQGLMSYEPMASLLAFGAEQGGEWAAWARVVRDGLERCQAPLEATTDALEACWREVADRAQRTGVNVRNTTVGQHIVLPPEKATVGRQP
jgi:hypothetical protein